MGNKINSKGTTKDLAAAALDWTSDFANDWRCTKIKLYFTTSVARDITISIYDQDSSPATQTTLWSKTAWTGQNLVITDAIAMDRNEEIRIEVSKTSGTAYFEISAEAPE